MLVWDKTSKKPKELEIPEMPSALAHLWGYFGEISLGRQHSMNGPLPLSSSEILAWSILTRTPLSIFDVRCIRILDVCSLNPQKPKDET